jgi:hypothetical protein
MKAVRLLYHLARADFLERARRYSFLITLGLTILAAYVYVPPPDANYLTLGLGSYRGVYNSAWIGCAVAVLSSALLSLPAFYLVKNAIERDERTKVGQIIATTPLTKVQYTLGKAVSNFVFLSAMIGVIMIAAGAMQILRAEVLTLDLWALLSPFLIIVLPTMAVIAALAILFEAIPWLRGTLGNVVYFVLWWSILVFTAANVYSDPRATAEPINDMWGILVILSNMMRDTAATFPNYTGRVAIGATLLQAPLQTFVWEGMRWTPGIILGRLLWVGIAIGISSLAAFFFHRFDPALEKPKRARDAAAASVSDEKRPVETRSYSAHLSPLSPRQVHLRFGSLLLAELRLMFKGIRWWWLVLALGSIVATVLVPTDIARQLLPLVWLLPLALWSSMGCREARFGTDQLVFSAPYPIRVQLPSVWLAGVLITLIMGGGVAIKLGLAMDWMHLLAWASAALFIPTLALAFGVLSGGNKLFEVVYMVLWYVGPVNRLPYLDFMGAGETVSLAVISAFGMSTIGLLGMAVWARRRQIQR